MKRPNKEVLTGDFKWMENVYVEESERGTSLLQDDVETIVAEHLTDFEQLLFRLRYGEQLPVRDIARRFGYTYHSIVQKQLDDLHEKVRILLDDQIHRP